jgi:hypothetical protein
VRDLPIAVYGCGEKAVHQALLLSALSDDVVLLCDRDSEIAPEQRIASTEPVSSSSTIKSGELRKVVASSASSSPRAGPRWPGTRCSFGRTCRSQAIWRFRSAQP